MTKPITPESRVLYRTAPAPRSTQEIFILYLVGITVFSMVVVPLTEKGQNKIRSWLNLRNPKDSSANEKNLEEPVVNFRGAVDAVEKFNKKGLTVDQAALFLKKSNLFSQTEIDFLLKNKEKGLSGEMEEAS